MTPEQNGDSSKSELLKLHHHDGDALLSAEMCVLRWHGNTLHQVLHLVLETAVYLFGVGKYFDSTSSELMFYMGTDVGYLRLLFYSGLGSVFIFVALNVFGLAGVICSRSYPGSYDIKAFAFALFCIFIIVNFKGLQVMSIFAIVLYFYASDKKNQVEPVKH